MAGKWRHSTPTYTSWLWETCWDLASLVRYVQKQPFQESVVVYTVFSTIFVGMEMWIFYTVVRLAIHRLALPMVKHPCLHAWVTVAFTAMFTQPRKMVMANHFAANATSKSCKLLLLHVRQCAWLVITQLSTNWWRHLQCVYVCLLVFSAWHQGSTVADKGLHPIKVSATADQVVASHLQSKIEQYCQFLYN